MRLLTTLVLSAVLALPAGFADAREGQRQAQGPKGGQREVHRSYDKESKSGSFERKATGKHGKEMKSSGTFKRNDDGSVTREVKQTGPKGNSREGSKTTTRTEAGRTTTGSFTNSNGGKRDFSRSVSRDGDSRTITNQGTHTTAGGKVVEYNNSRTVSGGGKER